MTKAQKQVEAAATIEAQVAMVQALADAKGFPPDFVAVLRDILERLTALEAGKRG